MMNPDPRLQEACRRVFLSRALGAGRVLIQLACLPARSAMCSSTAPTWTMSTCRKSDRHSMSMRVSTTPVWMQACSVAPYLIKDGSLYSTASYPALAQYLGSTYGGNGLTTFGLPDEPARARIGLDTLSVSTGTYAGRLTPSRLRHQRGYPWRGRRFGVFAEP